MKTTNENKKYETNISNEHKKYNIIKQKSRKPKGKYVKKTHENGNCTILENKYLAKP